MHIPLSLVLVLGAVMVPCCLNTILVSAADASEPTQFEVEHSLIPSATGRDFTSRGSLFYNDPRKQVADGTKKSPLHASKASLEGADLEAFKVLTQLESHQTSYPGSFLLISVLISSAS